MSETVVQPLGTHLSTTPKVFFIDMFETYALKGDVAVQWCCCANSAKRKAM